MAAPHRTQKQIASKYQGNLGYFRKPHIFRLVRLGAFVVAVAVSLTVAFGYRYFGPKAQEFYSFGPISANHKALAGDCDKCHAGVKPDMLRLFSDLDTAPGKPILVRAETLLKVVFNPEAWRKGARETIKSSHSLVEMDRACIQCHKAQQLHEPQMAAFGLRSVEHEISIVHADACSSCHREHIGAQKMKEPPSTTCVDCHSDLRKLKAPLNIVKVDGKMPPKTGEVRDFLNNGSRQFIPYRPVPHRLVTTTSFAVDHPPFGYEGGRDPGTLKYNHERHLRGNIPLFHGHKLACTDCHRPGPNGFMQRVSYESDCAECHKLQFDSKVPTALIPHGDPQKVFAMMEPSALTSFYYRYAEDTLKLDQTQQVAFVNERFEQLKRVAEKRSELLQHIFYDGSGQLFPGCQKCHEVTKMEGAAPPRIIPTNMADRWLSRGPFSHTPHQHMKCVDCHTAALSSTQTAQILLPSQKQCITCHRTQDKDVSQAQLEKLSRADRERKQGGILADCQSCHTKYHAAGDSADFANAVEKTTGGVRK